MHIDPNARSEVESPSYWHKYHSPSRLLNPVNGLHSAVERLHIDLRISLAASTQIYLPIRLPKHNRAIDWLTGWLKKDILEKVQADNNQECWIHRAICGGRHGTDRHWSRQAIESMYVISSRSVCAPLFIHQSDVTCSGEADAIHQSYTNEYMKTKRTYKCEHNTLLSLLLLFLLHYT